MLTVRETLTFAERYQGADRGAKATADKVDAVLKVMQLENCADTIVGNAFIRGVSGGEKRRVTIAEMLMGNPRVLALDEVVCSVAPRLRVVPCWRLLPR